MEAVYEVSKGHPMTLRKSLDWALEKMNIFREIKNAIVLMPGYDSDNNYRCLTGCPSVF